MSTADLSAPAGRAAILGLVAVVAAYVGWGVSPLYWKHLVHVDAAETLAQRYLWTLPFTALAVTTMGLWGDVRRLIVGPRRNVGLLCLSATALALNSGTYIWAVNHDRVIEASLGYFLTPLLTVLFGLLVFGERLRAWQWAAVALALAGVVNQIVAHGVFPWVGLLVGGSFATYAGVRKMVPAGAIAGFFVETAVIAPVAAIYLTALVQSDGTAFGHVDRLTDMLLIGGGVVTAVPLLAYAIGGRGQTLSTLGLLFYINPTCQFLVGVLVIGEPVTVEQALSFALIWAGLAIYTAEGRYRTRRIAPVS